MMNSKDLSLIKMSKEFDFDWGRERDKEIYKLCWSDTDEILGLMSILNQPEDLAIEIKLLETGSANVGLTKEIDRIAGCLIAYA